MYCHPLVLFSKEHLNSNVAECLKKLTQTAHGWGGENLSSPRVDRRKPAACITMCPCLGRGQSRNTWDNKINRWMVASAVSWTFASVRRTWAKWSCYPPGRRYWQNAHMLHGVHAVQQTACCWCSLGWLCSTVATRVLLHDNITPCTIA